MKTNSFAIRHIGPSESDLNHMFKTIGVENFDQLIFETIPSNIRLKNELNLDKPMTEYEYLSHIQELGKKNKVFKKMYVKHYIQHNKSFLLMDMLHSFIASILMYLYH